MAAQSKVRLSIKGDPATMKAELRKLTTMEVLVGFPDATSDRKDEEATASGITNAALGYIHDNGAPEQNIPARPFMGPGMAEAASPAADLLGRTARNILAGRHDAMQGFHRVGLKVQSALRRKLNEGIQPPLSERTLQARANRSGKGLGSRKGAKLELELRAAGWAPSVDFAKPLVDTGQLRNAISYVVRKRSERR